MELAVGQKAVREMTVTEDMVRAYAGITGDYNPLHFDVEFAGRTRFGSFAQKGWDALVCFFSRQGEEGGRV